MREYFSDPDEGATITIDGVTQSFIANGVSECSGTPIVQTFTVPAAALADGEVDVTLNAGEDDIALDWSKLVLEVEDVAPAPCGGIAAGCWHFDEPLGATTAIDSSGNANHGTYEGGVLLGVLGVLNTAARLDGVNDLVRVADSPSLDVGSSFSLEGWIKRSSTTKTHSLMLKGNLGLQLVVMNAGAGNQVYLRKANVTTIARSSNPVPADAAYHHIVATVAGANSARIYIDGIENTVQVDTTQVIQDTAFPLLFGSGNSTPADYDEFAVYDGVLTQEQVTARAALGGPAATE